MPHLLLFALGAAGLAVGYRWYVREQKRVAQALREAEAALNAKERRGIQTLERDSDTGIYRPPERGSRR